MYLKVSDIYPQAETSPGQKPLEWDWDADKTERPEIASKFTRFFSLRESGGKFTHDSVLKVRSSLYDATAKLSGVGPAANMAVNGNEIRFTSTPANDLSGQEYTLFWYGKLNTSGFLSFAGIINQGDGLSGNWSIQREGNGTGLNVFHANDTSAVWAGLWASITDGDEHVLIITCSGSTLEAWLDGVSQGTRTNATAPGYTASKPLIVGNARDGNRAALGDHYLVGIAKQKLLDEEIRIISRDPFILDRPVIEPPFFKSAGAPVVGDFGPHMVHNYGYH